MRILVTRPERPGRRTAERLAAEGHKVLLDPLLTLDFHPPERLFTAEPDAVVITSSNGVRAIAAHADLGRLVSRPLWTVGMRTTMAAQEVGFSTIAGEALDAKALVKRLRQEPASRLLYIAASVRAGDLETLLPGHDVETVVVYTAEPASALGGETIAAMSAGRIDAVLHYSRRLTETYLSLADAAGLGAEALAPHHLCLSEKVAEPLTERGARRVGVAPEPREEALLSLLPA